MMRLAGALLVALALAGCASGPPGAVYVDPKAPLAGSSRFNLTDLHIVADKMTAELLATPIFDDYTAKRGRKPVVRFSGVRNRTNEHVDMKLITDKIRTQLVKSGKVVFVEDREEEHVRENILWEQEYGQSGLVSKKTAPKVGKIKGAAYHLFGELVYLQDVVGTQKNTYYRFTLNLQNTTTSALEWSEEQEIAKVAQRPMFGG